MKAKIVDDVPYGIYVWQIPDGRIIADDEGNYLSIGAIRGDHKRIKMLRDAAREYGFSEGHAEFIPGLRKVTDEEYEEQKARLEAGLIPDPYDVGAYKDEVDGRINEHRN